MAKHKSPHPVGPYQKVPAIYPPDTYQFPPINCQFTNTHNASSIYGTPYYKMDHLRHVPEYNKHKVMPDHGEQVREGASARELRVRVER